MKIIILGDLHFRTTNPASRTDSILDTLKRKLTFVFNFAKEENAIICQVGDFFDSPRNWQALSEMINLLSIKICVIYGQHDLYLYSKERKSTALGILIDSGLTTELSSMPFKIDNVNIYGCSWGQEKLPYISTSGVNILVIHKSISDKPLFSEHDYYDAKKFIKSHPEYNLIFCGDIHKRFCYKFNDRLIVNPGPIVRMEATEYNMTYIPKFCMYDTEERKIKWVEIPHEPAEKVLTREFIENKTQINEMLNSFIDGCSGEIEMDFSFEENLNAFIEKNNVEKEVIDIISDTMMETK